MRIAGRWRFRSRGDQGAMGVSFRPLTSTVASVLCALVGPPSDDPNPGEFKDPIEPHSKKMRSDQLIDMMERKRSHQYEAQQEHETNQGQPKFSWAMAGRSPKKGSTEDPTGEQSENEDELHCPPILIPPASARDDAANVSEEGLEVELLVDPEKQKKKGEKKPQSSSACLSWHIRPVLANNTQERFD